ncbi:MAG: 4Fe-4S binding protein [Candidatus Krumholzibacteria bacterium]|jgi:iron only hydrogenase large subunit-like protein|nr:4Fe-4S binding protein [Candidatus Krumholzibacteria bacterium]
MRKWIHGFKIDADRCIGCLACMRTCPTQAVRVRDGRAGLLSELCIDCGSCLKVCPTGAIYATTRSLDEVSKFKFKVAVPSPVLFGQFPANVTPGHIVEGLKSMGFDAVWIFTAEIELANRAIREYVQSWKGKLPLITSSCPVIVRLVQVAYPGMVDQLIHLETPRELAGRELKRKYSEELGISKDEIAAIYVTSCQAKTISIIEPAEGVKSDLDGATGIADVYNGILASAQSRKETNDQKALTAKLLRSESLFEWDMSEGQHRNLHGYRYMSLTGLSNIIRVFDDIEKGKLRNIDFLECYACWGGCLNGNLTVDNLYISHAKLKRLMSELPKDDPELAAEVERRFEGKEFYAKAPILPRSVEGGMGGLKERIKRIMEAEAVLADLPGLDCGLCGAPDCTTQAKDIAAGDARKCDCVFLSEDRMNHLRRIYLKGKQDSNLNS